MHFIHVFTDRLEGYIYIYIYGTHTTHNYPECKEKR